MENSNRLKFIAIARELSHMYHDLAFLLEKKNNEGVEAKLDEINILTKEAEELFKQS